MNGDMSKKKKMVHRTVQSHFDVDDRASCLLTSLFFPILFVRPDDPAKALSQTVIDRTVAPHATRAALIEALANCDR